MQCPQCGQINQDDAQFCLSCGTRLKEPAITASKQAVSPAPATSARKQRKPRGRLFLAALICFLITGAGLGYAAASQGVELKRIFSADDFRWSKPPVTESSPTLTTSEETKPSQETTPATSATTALQETTPATSATTALPETTAATSATTAAATQGSTTGMFDDHYFKLLSSRLVLVDDKAHIWDKATIQNLGAYGSIQSANRGYTIMIVTAGDLFGLSDRAFANDYYDQALAANNEQGTLPRDGFLFLINLRDHTFYLSTAGGAIDDLNDIWMNEVFDELTPLMAEGKYAEAVQLLFERVSS